MLTVADETARPRVNYGPAHSPNTKHRVYIAITVLPYHPPCGILAGYGTPALVKLPRSRGLETALFTAMSVNCPARS